MKNLFVALFCLLIGMSSQGVAKESLKDWVSQHKYIPKESFLESAISNKAPGEVFNGISLLSDLLKELSIGFEEKIGYYEENNGCMYAFRLDKNYVIIFYGSPYEDRNNAIISSVMLSKGIDSKDISKELRIFFNQDRK
ncbi:MAG: hypothetical protein ABJQ29_13315 [Luteolibacter sp.]